VKVSEASPAKDRLREQRPFASIDRNAGSCPLSRHFRAQRIG